MMSFNRPFLTLILVTLMGPLVAHANLTKVAEAASKTLFADINTARSSVQVMERLGLFKGISANDLTLMGLKSTSRSQIARVALLKLAEENTDIMRFLETAYASGATGSVLSASQLSVVLDLAEKSTTDDLSRSTVAFVRGESTSISDALVAEEKAIINAVKTARYEGRREPFLNIYDVFNPPGVGNKTDPRLLIDIVNNLQGSSVPSDTSYPVVDYSADGSLVQLTDYELINQNYISKGRVSVLDTRTNRLVISFPFDYELDGSLVRRVVFSENFKTGVVYLENGIRKLVDFSARDPVEMTTFYGAEEIVLSPNGELVVVKMSNGTQALYRIRESVLSKILIASRPHFRGESIKGSRMNDEIFSQDGSVVVLQTGISTSTAYKIDPVKNTFDVMAEFPIMRTYMKLITPDGRFLLLGRGNTIVVRDLTSGGVLRSKLKLQSYSKLSDVNNMRSTLVYYSKDSKTIGLSVPSQLDVATIKLDGYVIGLDRAGEDFIQHVK